VKSEADLNDRESQQQAARVMREFAPRQLHFMSSSYPGRKMPPRPLRVARVPAVLIPAALLLSVLPLTACSPIFSGLTSNLALNRNPTAPAVQASADTLSGTYLGSGNILFVKSRFRLVLNVNPRANRADGVLTNLGNSRAYALTGKFVPVTADGGSLEAEIFEGSRKAGTLVARVSGGELRGTLATLALSYEMNLKRQP
jgi:hypothetical protein